MTIHPGRGQCPVLKNDVILSEAKSRVRETAVGEGGAIANFLLLHTSEANQRWRFFAPLRMTVEIRALPTAHLPRRANPARPAPP